MPASDLLVYTKTENLLFRLYPVLVNYPKAEKFALSQQIRECLYNTLRCISLGNSVKSKGVLKVDKNKIKKEGINNANQNA